MAGKLNAAGLRTLVKPGVYADGGGLYLQVRGANRRAWVFRYTLRGKARWMGLGALADVGLAEARGKAEAARVMLKAGTDPLAERRAEAGAAVVAEAEAAVVVRPFRDVAGAYLEAHAEGWKNAKHRQQWVNTLDAYVLPVIGDKPVAGVVVGDVMDCLQPIWRAVPETASRVRGRIEAVLDFATARGWRAGDNPARWKGHLDNLLPARSKVAAIEHHAALPWREIGGFMAILAKEQGVSALALRFMILTATRTSETLNATWGEIVQDGPEGAVWTIPAARMKAGRGHRVPLSAGALAVLAEAKSLRVGSGDDAPVFPGVKGKKPLSNMAILMLLRRMNRPDLTGHGFRSTFRDWCAEATNHPREIAEAALAHTLKDKTEAAYQRGDMLVKRARLMADWASFCARSAVLDAAVVPIRGNG
jgi:integrase